MVVSAEEEKERTLTILKSLFLYDATSVYKLSKISDVPQPTVKRYIPRMEAEGLIIKEKEETGRKTINPDITQKGILYLIFYADLTEEELVQAFNKYLEKLNAPKGLYSLSYETYRNTFKKIKSRINFDYYDQRYVDETFNELIIFEMLKDTDKVNAVFQSKGVKNMALPNRAGVMQLNKQFKEYEKKYKYRYETMKKITKALDYQLRS